MRPPDDRPDALRESPAAPAAPTEDHPGPETLFAYHERSLSAAEAERVQEHLVECRECADVVVDFAAFPDLEPPSEEHRLTPVAVRSQWRELQARIAAGRRPWWQRHELLLPIAAAFFAAAVGLGIWGWDLRQDLVELQSPRSVPFFTLSPAAERSRGAARLPVISAATARPVLLLPLAISEDGHPRYSLDVRGPSGRTLVRALEVSPTPDGVVVELPRDLLAPGENVLEVFGEARGARASLAEYRVLVEP